MRITIIIHSLKGGGAERATSHMATFWAGKGHDITVLTIASTADNRYTLPENVCLKPLGIDGNSSTKVSGILNNIRRIRILRQEIKQLNPHVVIGMMAQVNVMAGLACWKLPVKCIGSERNYPGMDYTGRLWGILRKYTYRFIDTVVTQTLAGEEVSARCTTALTL